LAIELSYLGRIWIEVKRFPGRGEGVVRVWVALLVLRDRLFELFLPNITPGAHSIANNLDIELRHLIKSWSEHSMSHSKKKLSEYAQGEKGSEGLSIMVENV
jgi:hypothetical protein